MRSKISLVGMDDSIERYPV